MVDDGRTVERHLRSNRTVNKQRAMSSKVLGESLGRKPWKTRQRAEEDLANQSNEQRIDASDCLDVATIGRVCLHTGRLIRKRGLFFVRQASLKRHPVGQCSTLLPANLSKSHDHILCSAELTTRWTITNGSITRHGSIETSRIGCESGRRRPLQPRPRVSAPVESQHPPLFLSTTQHE